VSQRNGALAVHPFTDWPFGRVNHVALVKKS